jgi:hypothetical protein
MYWGVLVGGPRWHVVATTAAKTSKKLEGSVASELNRLSETQRKSATVESTRIDKVVNDKVVSEYSAVVILPMSGAEVKESDLRTLETELSKRTADGEEISIEEIEKRAELSNGGTLVQRP